MRAFLEGARKRGREDSAADACAEVCRSIERGTLRLEAGDPKGHLEKILRRSEKRCRRRNERKSGGEVLVADPDDAGAQPPPWAGQEEAVSLRVDLERAWQRLSPQERQVLADWLEGREHMPDRDRKRLQRAREKLAAILEGAPTAGDPEETR